MTAQRPRPALAAAIRLASAARRAAATLACALMAAAPLTVAAGDLPDPVVEARLIDGWQTERGTRMVAVELALAPGWKTYWRAPGDTGIPPSFDWTGSRNLHAVAFHWPAPQVFVDSYGMRTIGFADRLVLPIELTPQAPGAPMQLRAEVDIGVCETVCIPARLQIASDLTGPGRPEPAIRAALDARPVSAAAAGVRSVACALSPEGDGVRLDAKIEMPARGGVEIALVETGDPATWVSEPQTARSRGVLHVRTDLVPPRGAAPVIDRSALRFTILGRGAAVDIRGCD